MMRQLRTAAVLFALSLLAWAATASAEYAWVMWAKQALSTKARAPTKANGRSRLRRNRRLYESARPKIPRHAGQEYVDRSHVGQPNVYVSSRHRGPARTKGEVITA
jgi:hypothetical protein